MRQDDNDFFVLVAGVLAAVVTIVVWWFWAGTAAPVVATGVTETTLAQETGAADSGDIDDGLVEGDAPSMTPTPTVAPAAEPTPTPAPTPAPSPTPAPTAESVLAAVAEDDRLGVFGSLLSSTGLDQELSGPGPFTLLSPTDDALAEAAADPVVLQLLERNPEIVLAHHIVDGDLRSEPPGDLVTFGGEALPSAFGTGDIVEILPAANGSVHVLDAVRVPPVAYANVLVDLEPILFAPGSAAIDGESLATLDRLVEVLATTTVTVTIEGHTDSTGDALKNRVLSEDRARAVLNYLVANGIDDSRLRAQGYGAEQPVADNETEQGRALNRRIEFSVG